MSDYYSPKAAQELVRKFLADIDKLVIESEAKTASYLSSRNGDVVLLRKLAAHVSEVAHVLERSK